MALFKRKRYAFDCNLETEDGANVIAYEFTKAGYKVTRFSDDSKHVQILMKKGESKRKFTKNFEQLTRTTVKKHKLGFSFE